MNGIFATVYGPSKTGKSTCTGAAGACGLFIANSGGLLPLKNFLGLAKVNVISAKNVDEAAKIILKEAGKHPTIVVDDFSLLTEQTITQLEASHSFGEMWRSLRAQVLRVRDAARTATEKGTHVIFNCHASPPKTSSGKYVRGGPSLPGQLPEQFSAFSDVVARVVFDETAAPWKFVLKTSSDSEYIGGDRLAIFPPSGPMNLAEALRAAGYELPRPKEMEWAEAVVHKTSELILNEGIEQWREVLRKVAGKLDAKKDPKHIRWALEDSLHRAIILNSKKSIVESLFQEQEDGW
tara:strand:- start:1686 stop:2567 length:882 start_codon:yes stop_codon:yes gene_type:complete